MNKKKIKYIGKLNNYKKYPRVKGAKNFTYFDEYYGHYGGEMSDFYPTIGVITIVIPLLIQIFCAFAGFYFGIYFNVGLVFGWVVDTLQNFGQ